MKKITLGLMAFIFSLSAFASMSQEDVLKVLKGRYMAEMGSSKATFVIRSSGKVMTLSTSGEFEYSEAELSFLGSSNSIGPDGLPVASLVFGAGSDEETRDIHILMTVEQGWSNEMDIKVITAFSTFNDGPNDVSSYEGQSAITLKKYNSKTKKYEVIK
ncbi:MAG: hypothetical protein EP326_05975 [Deltaproteobacteria bacterium]|nr:MAG: hypothetical protein EP326_05975 [Deltaproteobacteria bacterium]TNF31378.1 MAG: hypothetical protein EP319_02335 [Deltaproteobacteria bacterium]